MHGGRKQAASPTPLPAYNYINPREVDHIAKPGKPGCESSQASTVYIIPDGSTLQPDHANPEMLRNNTRGKLIPDSQGNMRPAQAREGTGLSLNRECISGLFSLGRALTSRGPCGSPGWSRPALRTSPRAVFSLPTQSIDSWSIPLQPGQIPDS